MDYIYDETLSFITRIKETETYQNYIKCKKALEQEYELRKLVDEFRRSAFEIQIAHSYGYYNSYEQLLCLKNENDELLSNPLVKDFLDAELKFTKMMTTICHCITENIDFNMDFLEQ